ncbi:DUF3300 domain-containing protein [Psychromonas sp.]|uniref:DUF3300 domain-containing protein n=1 Tax=Psychromonas sp. TaxID=1884585 RepID=UPI0035623529
MNKFTLTCYRSLYIALIGMLIMLPMVFINDADAQEQYAGQTEFSEAELAQILAPIALYPDSLLTHILIASTYPLEVVQANRWRTENRHFNAGQLMQKAENKNWDPSVIALLAFPNILEKLSDDLNWTQKLGQAFLQDEAALLASIQSLRRQADRAKSLPEMENMSVTRVDNQIIIEPAHHGIVYVPYYDSRVVYGHWYWTAYPPVYWAPYPYYVRRPHSHFYWHSGIQISFNYYFTTFNWHRRHLIVVNHRNSHFYRPRKRIISSEGAHRWRHKPQYIHRVPGGKPHHVRQRDDRLPNRVSPQKIPYNEHRRLTDNKIHINNIERNRDRVKRLIKQRDKSNKGEHLPQTKNDLKPRNRTESHQRDRQLKGMQPTQTKSDLKTRNRTEGNRQDKPLNGMQPTQAKSELKTRNRTEGYQRDRQLKVIQPTQRKSEQKTGNRTERVQQKKQQRRDKDTQSGSKCRNQAGNTGSLQCVKF